MSINFSNPGPNAQNPLLTPNFSQYASAGLVSIAQSPADVLAANPRVAATNAVTIGGSVTTGNTVTLTVTNPVLGGSHSVSYTTVAEDTVALIASHLANSLTKLFLNTVYQGQVFGTAVGAVVTVNQLGPVGNHTVVTGSVSAEATETITPAASGVMSGGSGPVVPFLNFNSSQGATTLVLKAGNPVQLNTPTVADLVSSGSPVI
jgi:hypothetical protein